MGEKVRERLWRTSLLIDKMSASVTASVGVPAVVATPAQIPAAPILTADVAAEGAVAPYVFQQAVGVDVTSNIATAPESKTLILNSKERELTEARATLQALGNAVQLAQGAITSWNPRLLSTNSDVRMDAAAKMFGQIMHVKRILPQMTQQEQVIQRLEKEIPALRLAIETWPSQAGLVGGYAYGGVRSGGFIQRPSQYYVQRPRYF